MKSTSKRERALFVLLLTLKVILSIRGRQSVYLSLEVKRGTPGVSKRRFPFLKTQDDKNSSLLIIMHSRKIYTTLTQTRREAKQILKFNQSLLYKTNRSGIPIAKNVKVICKAEVGNPILFAPPMKLKVRISTFRPNATNQNLTSK